MTTKAQKSIDRNVKLLAGVGITAEHAKQLRRISMTLRRWHEKECGTGNGCIERDEVSGKPCWLSSRTGRRFSVLDLEKGALKRLNRIMSDYYSLRYYVQTDPRGAALYVLRPGDVPAGERSDAWYSRGLCVTD